MAINWAAFDWPSFATLATGGMAVIAAVVIGLRQSSISERQTTLLARQARLEELALRADLFEMRYAVYVQTRDYILHIIHHAEVAEGELRNKFLTALNESRFVFSPDVHEHLDEIWKEAGNLQVLKAEMDETYRKHGHYGDGNPQRQLELLTWFSDCLRRLTDIFDEMKLGGHLLEEEVIVA